MKKPPAAPWALEWMKVLMPLLLAAFASFVGCEAKRSGESTRKELRAFVTEYRFTHEVRRLDRKLDAIAGRSRLRGPAAPADSSATRSLLDLVLPWRWGRRG